MGDITMKLEVGKKYRTLGGDIAECVAVWTRPDKDDYQATCIYLTGQDINDSNFYRLDGTWARCGSALEGRGRIVKEYKEPVRVADYLVPYGPKLCDNRQVYDKQTHPIGQQPEGAVLVPGSERNE
jgi:hypothetical protein